MKTVVNEPYLANPQAGLHMHQNHHQMTAANMQAQQQILRLLEARHQISEMCNPRREMLILLFNQHK